MTEDERTGYRSGERSPDPPGEDVRPAPGRSGPAACDLCGAPMMERHCKLVCVRCGYQRDCSDP
jgi:hypothetical protein